MKKILSFILAFILLNSNANTNEFSIFNTDLTREINPLIFLQSEEFLAIQKNNIPDLKYYFGNTKNKKKLSITETFNQFLANGKRIQNDDNYYVYEGCRLYSCTEKALLWVDKKNEIMIGLILHYYFDDLESDDGYFLIFSKQINNPNKIPEEFMRSLKQWNLEQPIYNFDSGKRDKVVIPEKVRFINFDDMQVIDITSLDLLNK